MKKSYLLLLMLFVSIVAMGGPVTPDEARQKITKFMNPRRANAISESSLKLVATSHYQVQKETMAASYYVFNVGEGQGFVIAGADDRVPAVLGYSSNGKFDPQNMPENMKAWLESYDDQMAYLNEHPEAAAPRKTVSGASISPLLQSEWNQGNPYNLLCPEDGGQHSVTGCVATAMAQVMYYHQWPKQTAAEIPGYKSSEKGFVMSAIPAGKSIDWENMVPKYTGGETDAQKQAVAELMLLCGTAVQMNYTASSSAASTSYVADAWVNYLDYDAATIYEDRSNYRLAAWNQKVYDELAAGRPVLYAGQSSGGGHAFVIDGYGGDDYFHVNWGWGGGSNNYFLLSILDPGSNSGIGASSSTDGYSYDQCAIFGAQPNTGVIPTITPIMTTSSISAPSGLEVTRTATTQDFQVDVTASFWNMTGITYTFDMGYGVYDERDILLTVEPLGSYTLDSGYGYGKAKATISFGANITSGSYIIKPISRETGAETWYPNKGTETYFLTATISDNTLTLQEPTFGLTGSIEPTGKQEVGSPLNLAATITNNGTLFNGQIFLFVDGKLTSGRHFDIDAGATENINFSFIPDSEGTKTVELCTRSWNNNSKSYDYNAFITGSVTVDAAVAANLSMYPTTKNAVQEGRNMVVKQNYVVVNVQVTNNGSSDYDNDVIVKLYKLISETKGSLADKVSKTIQLAAGASTDVDLQIDGLEDGAKYFYYVFYKSEGKEVKGYQHSPMFTVSLESGEEPQEETAYYLVSGLNEWSTTDQSYAFTKLDDGKTWEITFPANGADLYMKVAPGSAYDNQETFWDNLLCASVDQCTDLTGTMVKGNAGAWKLLASNNAKDYTMRIVPSEMTYEITFTQQDVPFVPEAPYYYIGTGTNWVYDATQVFVAQNDGTHQITVPAVYGDDGNMWFKIAPANAIAANGDITWSHLFSTDDENYTKLSGTMSIGDGQAWMRPQADGAESYTITINPETKAIAIQLNMPKVMLDPELAIQANEHYISELGYFTATLGQPFNSPALSNPHNVAPIVWTSSNPGVATVDENGVVTLLSIGGTQIRADFAGNDDYNPGYAEYYLEVSDTIGYVIEDDGTVTIVGGSDVTGDVVIGETVVIEGKTYQVTGIGDYAFNGNTVITSITIPDGINTIGAGAFDGCSQLMTISIGKGVTTIGEKAFAHIGIPANGPRRAESEGLLVKCYAENVPTTAADAFEGSPISSGTLLVEDNSVMAYYEATPWGQFGTVMGFNGTTGIERLVNSMGGGSISVFSLNGNKLAETQGAGLKQVLNTLPKGVYIIRVGNNSKAIRN
jgi:hypothetical protein